MAHSCPLCGMLCYCGGDIDDCQIDGTPEQIRCGHCADKEDEDIHDEHKPSETDADEVVVPSDAQKTPCKLLE